MSKKIPSIKEIKKHVTKKTIDPYIYLPNFLCPYFVKLMFYLNITANQLSVFSYLLYMTLSIFIALNKHIVPVIILLHFCVLIDCSDGTLAKARGEVSYRGKFFEWMSHETIPAFLLAGLSVYSYRILGSATSLYFGILAVMGILMLFVYGTSKQRMMYIYIRDNLKFPPKFVHGSQLRKDTKKGLLLWAYEIIQVLSSVGLLTAIITAAYIFNFLQYLIFFYSPYYLVIAVFKLVRELRIGFKQWGLR